MKTKGKIEKIQRAIDAYNDGNYAMPIFEVARKLADEVIEEQPEFIHFELSGCEFEITKSVTMSVKSPFGIRGVMCACLRLPSQF